MAERMLMRLMESMDIIKRWAADEELLHPQFNDYIEDVTLEEKPIDIWREKSRHAVLIVGSATIATLLYSPE